MPIASGSPFDGRALGETRARTLTGASIVAGLRGTATHTSPTPEFTLVELGAILFGLGVLGRIAKRVGCRSSGSI